MRTYDSIRTTESIRQQEIIRLYGLKKARQLLINYKSFNTSGIRDQFPRLGVPKDADQYEIEMSYQLGLIPSWLLQRYRTLEIVIDIWINQI
jgi:hypothetical protein